MEEIILEAEIRETPGKRGAKLLRQKGCIPAVVYGGGLKPEPLSVSRHDFLYFTHQYQQQSSIINLKVKGRGQPRTVLVKDIQYDPVKDEIIHIDFQEISLTSEIKVNVGIVSKGEPIGVKVDGGMLNQILWQLEIECMPTQIPREIEVDVGNLKIGDAIYVKDLSLPAGVKVMGDSNSIVFSVELPIKEEEIAPPPTEAEERVEPEVIKEKKELPAQEEK